MTSLVHRQLDLCFVFELLISSGNGFFCFFVLPWNYSVSVKQLASSGGKNLASPVFLPAKILAIQDKIKYYSNFILGLNFPLHYAINFKELITNCVCSY